MSGCCDGVLGQLCGEDEFYDGVVDDCALCSFVCDLCRVPESEAFCSNNCPGARPDTLISENVNFVINSMC